MSLKSDIRPANLSQLSQQLRALPLRQFEHVESEFFNRFFPRQQLGVVAQELAAVAPSAVSLLPERRWQSINGTQQTSKNTHLVRESHLLFMTIGALQEALGDLDVLGSDYWKRVDDWGAKLADVRKGVMEMESEIVKVTDHIQDSKARMFLIEREGERTEAKLVRADDRLAGLSAIADGLNSALSADRAEQRRITRELSSGIETEKIDRAREVSRAIENIDRTRQVLSDRLTGVETEIANLIQRMRRLETETRHRIQGTESAVFQAMSQIEQLRNSVNSDLSDLDSKTAESLNSQMSEISFINSNLTSVWEQLEKEAHADLVEKRKTAQANLATAELQAKEHFNALERLRVATNETLFLQDRESGMKTARDESYRTWKERWDLELQTRKSQAQSDQQRERTAAEREMLEMKLAVEREKLSIDSETRVAQARIEAEARIKDKRENEEVNLRELKAKSAEERENTIQMIREVAGIARSWVSSLYSSPENVGMAVLSVVALAAGIYLVREAAILAREQLNKRLGKPSLVRITNRKSKLSEWYGQVKRWLIGAKDGSQFEDVVLSRDLFSQIKRLANATKTAKSRAAPLLHCMFYGPPGTGKTMVAKRFAEYSGLEYAIMSGGDVAPLGENAVTEIHNLFQWVEKSAKGVLLFIDEAESFLGARHSGMSEQMKNALTAMLYHTGTASSQFMLILATNRPGDLDAAVLDRMDESIEFGLPDTIEREKLVRMYFDMYGASTMKDKRKLSKPSEPSKTLDSALSIVAERTAGFSGREISKLFMSLQTHVFSLGLSQATEEVLLAVTEHKVAEHVRSRQMQKHGYEYDAQKFQVLPEEKSTATNSPGTAPIVIEEKKTKRRK